jgi:hypothetical protein
VVGGGCPPVTVRRAGPFRHSAVTPAPGPVPDVAARGPVPDGTAEGEPAEPRTVWEAIRLDLIPLGLALGALVVNVVSPDVLSPGLAPLLFIAAAWVGYRIYRKAEAVRARR